MHIEFVVQTYEAELEAIKALQSQSAEEVLMANTELTHGGAEKYKYAGGETKVRERVQEKTSKMLQCKSKCKKNACIKNERMKA